MQNYIIIVRAVFEIWTKNIKNARKMEVFPHLRPPKIFFQKSGSVTFVPLWCPNFMQKNRKTNDQNGPKFLSKIRNTCCLKEVNYLFYPRNSQSFGYKRLFSKHLNNQQATINMAWLKKYLNNKSNM